MSILRAIVESDPEAELFFDGVTVRVWSCHQIDKAPYLSIRTGRSTSGRPLFEAKNEAWTAEVLAAIQADELPAMILDFCRDHGYEGFA